MKEEIIRKVERHNKKFVIVDVKDCVLNMSFNSVPKLIDYIGVVIRQVG